MKTSYQIMTQLPPTCWIIGFSLLVKVIVEFKGKQMKSREEIKSQEGALCKPEYE